MYLVIDLGNTSIKVGLFENDQLVVKAQPKHERALLDFIKAESPEKAILSSVRKNNRRLLQSASKLTHIIELNYKTPLPINNLYQTPQTLGVDRIASVVGAQFLYPNRNVLVIDAGTCITYDFLDQEANYHGGAISPGMDLKFKSLHKFTSKLPRIAFGTPHDLIGQSTRQSILSGVIHGTISEMEGIIGKYGQYFGDLIILVCGGKSKFFESKIKGHIFAIPDLVLIGLNQILRFNG